MKKYLACIVKEFLVLKRDKGGLAILFLMPMLLIFIITIIQDGTFRTLNNTSISIVLVNNDKDSLGFAIEEGLSNSGYFKITKKIENILADEMTAKNRVAQGAYQLAVIIPENATKNIKNNASLISATMLQLENKSNIQNSTKSEIKIYFDPATKNTFKNSIVSSLEKFIAQIELKIFMQSFSKDLGSIIPEFKTIDLSKIKSVNISEQYASTKDNEIIPNSVQHNVPAWTIFAMFFIVIPLSGSIIQEKDYGTALRIRTMPVNYFLIFAGKLTTFLLVCIIQFFLMSFVGIYLLPLLDLPTLHMGQSVMGLGSIVLASSLAAAGYGVLIGAIARTKEQAASFGSISVMILAAIGGIWVPVFAMPQFMRNLSALSPLNWGITGFYDIFLRNGSLQSVLPEIIKLAAFAFICLLIAYYFNERKNKITR